MDTGSLLYQMLDQHDTSAANTSINSLGSDLLDAPTTADDSRLGYAH